MANTPLEIQRIVEGYYRAQDAIRYASKFVLATELISDEDYKMIWSNSLPEEQIEIVEIHR